MTTDAEFVLDTPQMHQFITAVRDAIARQPIEQALEELRPAFATLLADPDWLAREYQQPMAESRMGGGIASWLLYRAADASLSLFSLVVPPGATTPVHDHLAWGLVGLYAGEQDEVVYQKQGTATDAHTELVVAERNQLKPGNFYVLLPPEGDIHSVATTSAMPSVSIHLLGNDAGCVWRHAYTPETSGVRPFRSGWSNMPCKEDAGMRDSGS